ncbi:MAG: PKD domain-containing protein [Verrucomicrobiia bacterium]
MHRQSALIQTAPLRRFSEGSAAFALIELLVVVAVIGSVVLLTPSVRAQTVNAQLEDLILGFYATGGTGGGVNLEVDLGSVSNFYNGANSGLTLTNLVTEDLIDTYGANWASRTDLFWAAAATDGNAGADPNGTPASTLWATGVPGNAAPTEGSVGIQGPAGSRIAAMYQGGQGSLNGAASTTNSSEAAVIQNTLAGSWSAQETSGESFDYFSPKIDGHVSSEGTLNLYELQPTSTFPRPAGTLLGTLMLTQSGLSFQAVANTNSAPPVASFSAAPTSGLAPLAVTFTDTSTGSITSQGWAFGDGGTSGASNPSYTYTTAGVYTVALTVFGPGGSNTSTRANLITVGNTNSVAPPVAAFSGSPTNGVAPLTVNFVDNSTGTITNRFWTFGDGGTTNTLTTSVAYTYNSAGTYTVALTVFGPGGTNTSTQAGYVVVGGTIAPPMAAFRGSPTNGVAPLTVSFVDNSTGAITNQTWNFGDGGTSTTANPSHSYTNAGVYTVTLTVYGPGGTDTLNRASMITITSTNILPTPALRIVTPGSYQTFTYAAILVAGTASDASGIKSVAVNGGHLASLLGTNWFANITLVQGTNVIAVIATDNSLDTATQIVFAVLSPSLPDTNQAPVIVSAPTVMNALLCLQDACIVAAGDTNMFSVGAIDPNDYPLNYAWNFGDGTSSAPSPTNIATHVYTNCGPYYASVTVSDGIYLTNASLTVSVPCAMNVSSLKLQAKFRKVGSDACTIKGTLTDLPEGFSVTNAVVSLDVGGAIVDIQLNAKGSGANSNGNVKFSHNKQTGVWTFTGKLKGDLKGSWATYGITSGTVISSDVPSFPVLLMLQSDTLETFNAELPLSYSNSSGTSGTATLLTRERAAQTGMGTSSSPTTSRPVSGHSPAN